MGCSQSCSPVKEPLTRDKADMRIDRGRDECKIEIIEDGYPHPSPPKNKDQIKKKDAFFDDDEFQLASDDADLFDTETANDDISVISYKASVPGKKKRRANKSQCTTEHKKISFADVDDYVSTTGTVEMETIKELVTRLKEPWQHDEHLHVKTARAIVMWLSRQGLDKNYGDANDETPNGLLQMLKEDRMTYATCYTILCRAAGLQCALIKGYVKAAGYEPGDKSVSSSKWTAVYCENGWQIVHPFWICRALYGHKMGGWIKVEADGTRMSMRETSSHGVVRNTFQERYFLPKPEEFVYECSAKDSAWQLVEPNKQVKSREEFLTLPYLLPPFHGLGLQLVSEQNCELKSKNGFCKIEFKGRTTNSHLLLLKYELFKKDTDDGNELDDDDASRMVFNSRSNEHFVFDIRFPMEGVYKLIIYGGPYRSAALRLCEFKIVCEEPMTGYDLLPLSCNKFGWGPSPVTLEAGLIMPSKPSGLVPVEKNGPKKLKTEIKFRIRDDFIAKHEYAAQVHGRRGGVVQKIDGSDYVAKQLQVVTTKHMEVSITKDSEFVVQVNLPNEGEFGVTIHERKLSSTRVNTNAVCNYLASTLEYDGIRIGTRLKILKAELSKECEHEVHGEYLGKKIANIEDILRKCKKEKMPVNDEDICVAETKLEYLKCKNLIRDTKLRRQYHVTIKTLAIMSRYKYRVAFQAEIKEVEKLREELRKEIPERKRNF